MLFSSPLYIFLFLPIVVSIYFWLNARRLVVAGKAWLVISSLFFYGYWDYHYLLLIVVSMLVNYALGNAISSAVAGSVDGRHRPPSKKAMLIFGVLFNLLLLSYFKYFDFFLANINVVFEQNFPMLDLLLPLAISFFTFQQIAYLVDSYRLETREYDFLNYCLFVTFFPQLIAGPIVHHSQMMPQFDSVWNRLLRWRNVAQGSFIFAMGLFKKIVIADSFAVWADQGFDSEQALSFFDAWGRVLAIASSFIMTSLVIVTWPSVLLCCLIFACLLILTHPIKR